MRLVLVFLVALCGAMMSGSVRGDVTISAAISLKAALEKAKPALEKAAGERVRFTFGASGTLASQIRQGAPVDLFISADRANVTRLTDAKLADKTTVRVVAGNALVLIVPGDKRAAAAGIGGFADLAKPSVKRVAIGEPRVVPAGKYAKETLVNLHLWDGLERSGELVTAENVAQVLAFVERGEVDAGLVYRTDAKAGKSVKVVAVADEKSHASIDYVSAVVSATTHRRGALAAQQALLGAAIQKILRADGFSGPSAGSKSR